MAGADADEAEQVRAEVARRVVEHTVETDGRLANPADDVAKLRRAVLRGLRERSGARRNGF